MGSCGVCPGAGHGKAGVCPAHSSDGICKLGVRDKKRDLPLAS